MMERPLIWISIDSLRKDHTSGYDGESDSTPELASKLKNPDFQQFTNCISHAKWTRSSVGSILTGTHPEQHQVGMELNQAVPSDLPTVAELFSQAGYDTACLTENGLIGPDLHLDRGFDDYFHIDMLPERLLEIGKYSPDVPLRYLALLFSESGGLSRNGWEHSLAHLTTMTAEKWIARHQDSPFFLYLHYNDPHHPYCPSISQRGKVADEAPGDIPQSDYPDFAIDIHNRLYELIAEGIPLSETEMELLKALYDAEIRHTDKWIGRLLEYVLETVPKSRVVITADHGELFGEGGGLAHKLLLHDALVNVPLITYNFEELSPHTSDLIQHIDIVKTALEPLDVRTDTLAGKDLRQESRSIAVSQRSPGVFARNIEKIQGYNPEFDVSGLQPGELTAFRTKTHKLLVGEESTRLVSVKDESRDLSEDEPGLKRELEAEASEWFDNVDDGFAREKAEISESMESQLADLGYLG